MKDVLDDGVYWRFLDPYTSWVRIVIPRYIAKLINHVRATY